MLLVFDLDFTLWDCGGTWCDCTEPPYRKESNRVFDSAGRHISLYPEVREILEAAERAGLKIAAASRTHQPDWAEELLELLEIGRFFDWKEIYPGPKIPHFNSLKKKSGIEYEQMYFFDDELRNIRDVSSLGVRAVHVGEGLNRSHLVGIPAIEF